MDSIRRMHSSVRHFVAGVVLCAAVNFSHAAEPAQPPVPRFDVANMDGGMKAWEAAGKPLSADSASPSVK